MLFCRYIFTFRFLKKYNSQIGEFSSSIIHSGTSHCPGMDLAGTRDISFHSGTVPGNPGHLVTLIQRRISLRSSAQAELLVRWFPERGLLSDSAEPSLWLVRRFGMVYRLLCV